MSTSTKIWLIIAASLLALGILIFTGAVVASGGDFAKFDTAQYETNIYELGEFSDISMKTDTADIRFVPSDDGTCRVVCYEQENQKHSVRVTNGVLTIETVNTQKWYDHISISFESPKITVYLPQAQYASLTVEESTGDIEIPKYFAFKKIDISTDTGDVLCCTSASEMVKIRTSTGHIDIADTSTGMIDLSVSTGRVTVADVICDGNVSVKVSTGKTSLQNITCKNVISSGSTGDISLENVIATENFSIERSTGDVMFDLCDAVEIRVDTDTGDVSGTLLSEKVFIAESDTGRVDVPYSTTGGKCEVSTDTGDIKITLTK